MVERISVSNSRSAAFRMGEPDASFVSLLLAGLLGFFLFLRFEAISYVFGSLRKRGLIQPSFSRFGAEFHELIEVLVIGALVGGLVAQI